MDLMMPGFDGYMVLDAMRKYEAEHRVEASKVIVISGKSIEEGLTPQLQRQCDDYLSKPVDSQRVLSSMEALGII
jgi:CheY-like chemotaxis protein